MSALQAEVYEAFRILDVPDEKALRAAVALSAAMATVEDKTARSFDKRDADIEAIRSDISSIKGELGDINTRMASMQGDLNGRMTSMQGDLNGRMTSMQGDLNGRMTSMQGEINLLKWMMGTTIAMLVTVMFRVFTH